MAVVVYFFCAFVFLMIGISPEDQRIISVRNIYIWTVFGGIDDATFDTHLSFIVVVLGTLLVSVVLLNILIAYLSNLFSSLEETQILDDLREKASFVFGIEIILRFFRYFISGKIKMIRTAEVHNYNLMVLGEVDGETDKKVGSFHS